ncbi:response regulator [Selenomonas sp.]|uniref:response regulator n=1 Tax=Selenomonas sp. TaxID=2053611 RepID=UPI003A101C17
MKLLVADGNPADSQQLQLYLGQKVNVISVLKGQQVLDILAQHPVDLLITADKLPDMTGFDLLRAVHEQAQYKNLPVIITTADHSQKTEAASAMAGGFRYHPQAVHPHRRRQEGRAGTRAGVPEPESYVRGSPSDAARGGSPGLQPAALRGDHHGTREDRRCEGSLYARPFAACRHLREVPRLPARLER